MVSMKIIVVFVFAVVACAFAIPAGPPQPRPIAEARRDLAESEKLQAGADEQDLKASSSYGYGYYGGYGGYGGGYNGLSGYYGALGYHPYSYNYGYSYPYSGYGYYSALPYNRGYGSYYGGYY